MQSCNPALGAILQSSDLFLREREAHGLFQKTSCLLLTKTQVRGTDLQQLTLHAPAGEGKRGINTAGEHQMQVEGQMIKEEDDRGVNGRICDEMIVLQDENHLLRKYAEFIEKSCEA